MPQRSKGARLYWRIRPDGTAFYQIRDGSARIPTGTSDVATAEAILADYIASRNRPTGPTSSDNMTISLCLAKYGEEHALHVIDPVRIGYAIEALDQFFQNMPLSEINGQICRRYVRERRTRTGKPASTGTTRRELNVLQAAINFCHREGYLTTAPKVTLPPHAPPRERWLTRQEAAWLLRGARHLRKDGRHLVDFILHGLYTGSRKQTILDMHLNTPSTIGGYVNTETGVFYRKPISKAATNKRQNPARLPSKYLAYLRRQARNGRRYVVEDCRGGRVGDIKNGWKGACMKAMSLAAKKNIILDLSDVTPHTLKHTAITWTLQKGATIWDTAGYFSTSPATIEKVYGHHSPHHQKTAVDAGNRKT